MARTLNNSRPTGSVGSWNRSAEAELDLAGGELGDDVAGVGRRASGVGQRAGEPVELGHDQGVAGAAGGHRLAQPGPGPVGSGEAVVDVDPVGRHAERGEGVALRREVLLVSGDPGRSRSSLHSLRECPSRRPFIGHFTGRVLRESASSSDLRRAGGTEVSRWGFGFRDPPGPPRRAAAADQDRSGSRCTKRAIT
jgi:hypothetical protein